MLTLSEMVANHVTSPAAGDFCHTITVLRLSSVYYHYLVFFQKTNVFIQRIDAFLTNISISHL